MRTHASILFGAAVEKCCSGHPKDRGDAQWHEQVRQRQRNIEELRHARGGTGQPEARWQAGGDTRLEGSEAGWGPGHVRRTVSVWWCGMSG